MDNTFFSDIPAESTEFPSPQEICQLALQQYGQHGQLDKTIEECAELTVAIQHYKSGRHLTPEAIVEETADVIIMCEQLRMLFGTDAIDAAIDRKLGRLAVRLGVAE